MLVKDDAPERYSSDLYYDFFDGGYLSPQEFLEAEEDIEAVKEARAVQPHHGQPRTRYLYRW
jgi:hypothetical protein